MNPKGVPFVTFPYEHKSVPLSCRNISFRDLSEISKGSGGTEGGSQLFETAEKGGVMKNGPLKGGGSCKYMCVFMKRFTHRRKRSSLFCKKKSLGEIGELSDQRQNQSRTLNVVI